MSWFMEQPLIKIVNLNNCICRLLHLQSRRSFYFFFKAVYNDCQNWSNNAHAVVEISSIIYIYMCMHFYCQYEMNITFTLSTLYYICDANGGTILTDVWRYIFGTSSLHLPACSRSTWLFSTKTEWCYSAVTHLQTPQIRKLSSTLPCPHHCDVIFGAMASQITSLMIVYSTVHSGPDQRNHQSSAPLAFMRRIHQRPVNSPRKWKMFPFDDVIMYKVLL